MRREVYLLCFGPGRELLTVRPRPGAVRALPSVRRRERETYEEAARGLMGRGAMRAGDTVARIGPVPAWAPDGRREARLVTCHASTLFPFAGGIWEPWETALAGLRHPGGSELGAFVEGYLGGWIPGGWITLGP
ncbi:hypothetical protein [Streptomyces cinereoruber]|uniref:hypothetical protein n=1 Tax=Streptomyces cinereoruber TaxID=67260 RepID=UPI0036680A88